MSVEAPPPEQQSGEGAGMTSGGDDGGGGAKGRLRRRALSEAELAGIREVRARAVECRHWP
jgi:hypothetical protein